MRKNEHAINMTNKLINAVAGHALRISTAEVDAVLACKIGTAGFIEDGIVIHLSIIRLKKIVGRGICLRKGNTCRASGIFILLRGEHVGKGIVSSGESTSSTGLIIAGLVGVGRSESVVG